MSIKLASDFAQNFHHSGCFCFLDYPFLVLRTTGDFVPIYAHGIRDFTPPPFNSFYNITYFEQAGGGVFGWGGRQGKLFIEVRNSACCAFFASSVTHVYYDSVSVVFCFNERAGAAEFISGIEVFDLFFCEHGVSG